MYCNKKDVSKAKKYCTKKRLISYSGACWFYLVALEKLATSLFLLSFLESRKRSLQVLVQALEFSFDAIFFQMLDGASKPHNKASFLKTFSYGHFVNNKHASKGKRSGRYAGTNGFY